MNVFNTVHSYIYLRLHSLPVDNDSFKEYPGFAIDLTSTRIPILEVSN